jgi:hypothetical protein
VAIGEHQLLVQMYDHVGLQMHAQATATVLRLTIVVAQTVLQLSCPIGMLIVLKLVKLIVQI